MLFLSAVQAGDEQLADCALCYVALTAYARLWLPKRHCRPSAKTGSCINRTVIALKLNCAFAVCSLSRCPAAG